MAYRRQIFGVAAMGMAPVGADPSADRRTCLVAYAQIGELSELRLAWDRGHLAIDRAWFVGTFGDPFVRIDDRPPPGWQQSGSSRA